MSPSYSSTFMFKCRSFIGDGNQFLTTVFGGAHQNKNALLVIARIFQADVEVDAVGPQVHVAFLLERTPVPGLPLLLSGLFQPDNVRGREASGLRP